MIRLTLLFCLVATIGIAQFSPIFTIPSNYTYFDVKGFEMNDAGQIIIITDPYNSGPTSNLMVYTSSDFGETWDSTYFANQFMMKDNAFVTESGITYFTTVVNVPSPMNPPGYQKKILHRTLDFGETWLEKTIDTIPGSHIERALTFLNDSTGLFFYYHGVYITTDYGQNWDYIDSIPATSAGLLDDQFIYYTYQEAYTYNPFTGSSENLEYLPYCEGNVDISKYNNGINYNVLTGQNVTSIGPEYNHNFASLNSDVLPLGKQKVVHFPQRYALIDLELTENCIHMVLDGQYVRSCDGGNTFYNVDAFDGNINENLRYLDFINDTLGFAISQNLITYEWHLWKTTNGGGVTTTKVLTNDFYADVKELQEDASFELYPNPTNDKIKIESKELISEIEIYALDGKLVFRKLLNDKEITLEISSLAEGNYVVKVSTANTVGFSKLVKI